MNEIQCEQKHLNSELLIGSLMNLDKKEFQSTFEIKQSEIDGNKHLNNVNFIIFQNESSNRILTQFQKELMEFFQIDSINQMKLSQSECKFISQCFYPHKINVKTKIKLCENEIKFHHEIVFRIYCFKD
jgi:acyl-CoA thioesterase FadM